MIGSRLRVVAPLIAMAAAVTLTACATPPSTPAPQSRWVETQEQAPDLGIELPTVPPSLDEAMTQGDGENPVIVV